MWEFNMILINWHLWSHSRLGSVHKSSQVCWQIQSLSRASIVWHFNHILWWCLILCLSIQYSLLWSWLHIAFRSLRQKGMNERILMASECWVSSVLMMNQKKNHTNSLHLQATWRRVKNTWFSQFKDQQNAILKILLLHVTQQIDRDNIEAAIDINSVANSYINTLNNLSITKTHNSSTLKTSSFIESIWMLFSSSNWFFDNLLSTDSRKHKEITSP